MSSAESERTALTLPACVVLQRHCSASSCSKRCQRGIVLIVAWRVLRRKSQIAIHMDALIPMDRFVPVC